ncbi:putative F-box/LRR-repeat protein 23 [Salvia divinorum]|uniref:F-box/LRR-repeat protein 23 n=1 Tax=Salvia divinorum TaxID=28513 RepID=A0ABD1HH53_SALDI
MAASSSSAAPPPSPPWTELPDDLTAYILQRLNTEQIVLGAQLVCSTWWRVCKNPALWRVIDVWHRPCSAGTDKFGNICRCGGRKLRRVCGCSVGRFWNIYRFAMGRSEGELVELKLAGFEVDGFLDYVTLRSSQLRRLTLDCYDTTKTEVLEALKKLPQLEELHLKTRLRFSPKDFETIGSACPVLKSLTYTNSWISKQEFGPIAYNFSHCWDRTRDFTEHAVAIGKTMPNLCLLQVFGQRMGMKGLEAIVDGCPHLDSLDLRGCSSFDMNDRVVKRCYEQIKDVWLCSIESAYIRYISWLTKESYQHCH